ncbi:MAG: helix-turn-helix transcriptional regulator [Muribaculum sp.]|nr:helix-turn-helix transcriptional regulator [Muribaculum sp.]
MLKDVNQLIPNNLTAILKEKNLTIADCVRKSGLTRPTVKKLVDGEDSYISKMKSLADGIGVSLSSIYSNAGSVFITSSSHDNSTTTNVGFQVKSDSEEDPNTLKKRIEDLENLLETKEDLIRTKDELLRSKEELLAMYRNRT